MLSNRPKTWTDEDHIKQVKEMVLENHRLTIREIVDSLGISFGSVQAILIDEFGLRRVKSHLVPKMLNFFKKQRRIEVCKTSLPNYQDKLKCIITRNET
jgi:hypothetical protein